jgi:hypothetical protein
MATEDEVLPPAESLEEALPADGRPNWDLDRRPHPCVSLAATWLACRRQSLASRQV